MMDMSHTFWEDSSNMQHIKYESAKEEHHSHLKDEGAGNLYACCNGNLNFSTAVCSEDDSEYGSGKKNKVSRQDPMSHRIIEKRRRDRMNNCLADLSRLIPAEYLKKGRGRIEKTEIIEMAIKHMKYLQQLHATPSEHYRLGYQECMSETMRFLVEVEGHFPRESICVRLLNHLQKHCESLSRGPPPSSKIRSPPDLSTQQNDQVPEEQLPVTDLKPTEDLSQPKCNGHNLTTSETNISTLRNGHSESDPYEKHSENSNGAVSYKYKTDIKHRFNQEFNGVKRQRLDSDGFRRSSITSSENQSTSHSSPPSSEVSARMSNDSDVTLQQSVMENNFSRHNYLKSENNTNLMYTNRSERQSSPHHHPSIPENPLLHCNGRATEMKNNFNVPVFVLNAKGSFYIPATIDYYTLLPFLHNYNLIEGFANINNIVLHPVTINVNFQPNGTIKYKSECENYTIG